MTKLINKAAEAQEFLGAINAPFLSIYPPSKGHRPDQWGVGCYWPNGDILKDTNCMGNGDTLEAAVTDMWVKVEKVKAAGKVLKTAAECKKAVIALIREHDAAPASFRDAVDALPVKP